MLCRVADDLFWMARYVERGIAVSRLIDVTRHLELDAGEEETDFWGSLVGPNVVGDVRYWLTSDETNPDSLVSCVRNSRALARGVRDAISSEMWEELNQLHFELQRPSSARDLRTDASGFARMVRDRLQHTMGLADCTLAHDEPWNFVMLGQYLERAFQIAKLLRQQAHLLTRTEGEDALDVVKWLAVLRSCGSAEAYARYYSLRVEPARIVEFLVLNPVFPQSLRFALGEASRSLGSIASLRQAAGNQPGPAPRTLGRVRSAVENTAVDEIFDTGLGDFLDRVQRGIEQVSQEVTATYLHDQPQAARLIGVARAAQLMAEQQQQ